MASVRLAVTKSIGFLLLAVLSLAAQAQVLSKPLGPVILTVSGKISHTNSPGVAEFDAAMLDALPGANITTSSPWRSDVATYSGPTLKALLTTVGASGQTLRMTALDDYAIKVPIDDAEKYAPVLTRKINGVPLKVKDRGPLFMVYPFDDLPALKKDEYYSRSIWHLTRIVVE